MRIVFCDDNPIVLAQLRRYVQEYFDCQHIPAPEFAEFSSGDALVAADIPADIAFLDVEMPGLSGIHTGARLKEKNPYVKILIVTAYPDYLDEAMRYQVFRYLSKPVDKHRLFRNLKEAIDQYNAEVTEYPVITADGIQVCRSDEIVCMEASRHGVLVYTKTDVLKTTTSLDHWQNVLSLPCFYMPHRSYILNMRFVSRIQKDSVLLKAGELQKEVYLARRRYADFKNTYLLYLEREK